MTAVIGMLNKNGVAIAADSAVTRNKWNKSQKITKNGNKMLRLSNLLPVSAMITGNADFLGNPWDVIIRKYRKERGDITHSTVEDIVKDLLRYITDTDFFWDDRWLKTRINHFFKELEELDSIFKNLKASEGELSALKMLLKEIVKFFKIEYNYSRKAKVRDYDFGKFCDDITPSIKQLIDEDILVLSISEAVRDNWEKIKGVFLKALFEFLTFTQGPESATLIFTGYGKDEIYPSLIAIDINEGFNRHVNWEITQRVNISDKTPSAICPFAQTDVIDALLTGVSKNWLESMYIEGAYLYQPYTFITNQSYSVYGSSEFTELEKVSSVDFKKKERKMVEKAIVKNKTAWIKDLEGYDVRSMAELASTLVDLTGLQRILTFDQEGVGGDVDLAVITKTDGFTWLNRKSWYYHKDIGGRYGSMGV